VFSGGNALLILESVPVIRTTKREEKSDSLSQA